MVDDDCLLARFGLCRSILNTRPDEVDPLHELPIPDSSAAVPPRAVFLEERSITKFCAARCRQPRSQFSNFCISPCIFPSQSPNPGLHPHHVSPTTGSRSQPLMYISHRLLMSLDVLCRQVSLRSRKNATVDVIGRVFPPSPAKAIRAI